MFILDTALTRKTTVFPAKKRMSNKKIAMTMEKSRKDPHTFISQHVYVSCDNGRKTCRRRYVSFPLSAAHTFMFHAASHCLTNEDDRKWLLTLIFLVTGVKLWWQKNVCDTYGFYPWSLSTFSGHYSKSTSIRR